MLFLLFQLGQERYALGAGEVAEVLPWVAFTAIPQAPPGLAGIFNYRGSPVPLIDLSQLMLGRSARRRLNTRIVLVHYLDDSCAKHLLGLIAEGATETLRREPSDFASTGVKNPDAPYLGPVVMDALGMIRRIEVNQLLPQTVRDLLFHQPSEA